MQSFLQYRRFGNAVKEQYERHHAMISKGQHANRSQSLSPSQSRTPLDGARDLEKGQPDSESGSRPEERLPVSPESEETRIPNDEIQDDSGMQEMQMVATQKSTGTRLGTAMTGIDVRDRRTREGKKGSRVFVVGYEGDDDSLNPHNWSFVTRMGATLNIAAIGWIVGFASAIDSAALEQATAAFGVSEVTESLATGLFLIGFGCGALFAGPISETIGRNPVYIVTLSLYMIFIMASGLAPSIGAQLAFRFLAGFFGSTPLTCAGGSVSDLWNPMERVYAFPIFANAAFMGPIFGPVVGGFIGESSRVSWRWTEWITLIISGLILGLVILFQPETYPAILLKWKASYLREITGDDRFRAEVEIMREPFLSRLKTALYRPFLLTFYEPVILLLALYLTVIYIILFTFLTGYTFIFTETYGFTEGITGLVFIGIAIGLCGASLIVPLIYGWARKDLAKIKSEGGTRLPPEFRLWFAMLGAPAITISMFWMGWTAYPTISYWSPLAASVLFGYGILCVFISSYQYIIDSYETYSASALASVTLIRYVAAGGMVEVATPMYKNLGVHWTLTILGCISALMVPVPYLFYAYGSKLRSKSRYATV